MLLLALLPHAAIAAAAAAAPIQGSIREEPKQPACLRGTAKTSTTIADCILIATAL